MKNGGYLFGGYKFCNFWDNFKKLQVLAHDYVVLRKLINFFFIELTPMDSGLK
jgi:hypothetical protein